MKLNHKTSNLFVIFHTHFTLHTCIYYTYSFEKYYFQFQISFETIDDSPSKMNNSMYDTHICVKYTKELKIGTWRNIYKIIGSIVAINVGNAILLIKSRGELTASAGR